jgi:hypothetical protein
METKLKCNCCGKTSGAMCQNVNDYTIFCSDCLKYAPNYYGQMSSKCLKDYIQNKKKKRWWQIWKR